MDKASGILEVIPLGSTKGSEIGFMSHEVTYTLKGNVQSGVGCVELCYSGESIRSITFSEDVRDLSIKFGPDTELLLASKLKKDTTLNLTARGIGIPHAAIYATPIYLKFKCTALPKIRVIFGRIAPSWQPQFSRGKHVALMGGESGMVFCAYRGEFAVEHSITGKEEYNFDQCTLVVKKEAALDPYPEQRESVIRYE